jgi:hypothetical protein
MLAARGSDAALRRPDSAEQVRDHEDAITPAGAGRGAWDPQHIAEPKLSAPVA